MKDETFNDFRMLLTCKTIAEDLALHIKELQQVNPVWTEGFSNELLNRVDSAFDYYLGLESNRRIEDVRNKLNHIQAQALRAIAFLKTRIDIAYAFNERKKNEVLNKLGFRQYLQAVQDKDTTALLDILSRIHENLSDSIRKDLIKNPSDEAFLMRITQFATRLRKANLSQQSLMATKKAIAENALKTYRELVYTLLEISQMATSYYKKDPQKASMFDYSPELMKYLSSSTRIN